MARYGFDVYLNDLMSSPLMKMARLYDTTVNNMTGGAAKMARQFQPVAASVDRLNDRLNRLKAERNLSIDTGDVARADRDIARIERRLLNLQNAPARPKASMVDNFRYAGNAFGGATRETGRVQGRIDSLTADRAGMTDPQEIGRATRQISQLEQQLIRVQAVANRPASGLFTAMQRGVGQLTALFPNAQQRVERLQLRLNDLTQRRALMVDFDQAIRADRQIQRLERDLARAQERAARPAGSGFFGSMTQGAQRMARALVPARQSVDSLNSRLNELRTRRDLMVGTGDIRRANREIEQLERRVERMQNSGRRGAAGGAAGGGIMGAIGGAALPYMGAAALAAGAVGFAKSGMDRQQTQLQFKQFLKTDEATSQMFGQLNTFADKTPYTNDEVYQAGKSMLVAGVNPGQVKQKMTNVGNLAAGSGTSFADLSQAYAKIKMKDFIDGGELHQEFGNVPLMKQLQKNLGVGSDQLFKMAEKKQIRFSDVDKAISDMSTGKGDYAGALQTLANSAGGKLSTFMGTMGNKIAGWAASQNSVFGSIFDFGTDFLAKMQPVEDAVSGLFRAFAPLGDSLKTLFGFFGLASQNGSAMDGIINILSSSINGLTTVVSGLVSPLGQFYVAGAAIYSLLGMIPGAIKAITLAFATNPFTIWLVGIGALVVGLKWAYDNLEWFKDGVDRVRLFLMGAFDSIGTILKALIMPTPANISGALAAITKAWQSAGDNVGANAQDRKRAKAENDRDDRGGIFKPKKSILGGAFASTSGNGGGGKDKDKGVTSGVTGAKSTNITINLKSLVEGGVHVHAATVTEGLVNIESQIKETLLRVLNSSNAMETA